MSNFCRSDINCSRDISIPETNSDIAGTGVVIGFVGTAYVVLFLLFIHYLVAFDPDLPPPSRESVRSERFNLQIEQQNEESSCQMRSNPDYWRSNAVDVHLLTHVRQAAKMIFRRCPGSPTEFGTRHSAHIQRCFDRAISSMCDIQIITGISILTGGFICLDGNLSSHHWQLIVYLAWFSSITHLSALTSLRRYLQVHPREKCVRLSLMLLLLMMLVTAMVPTAFFNWRSSLEDGTLDTSAAEPNMPAVCFFSIKCGKALYHDSGSGVPFIRSNALQETLLSLVLLIMSFITRAMKLSTRVSSVMYRTIAHPVGKYLNYLSKRLDNGPSAAANGSSFIEPSYSPWTKIATGPAAAVIVAIRTQGALLNSMLIEQCWLLVVLLWGTSKLKRSLYEEWYYGILWAQGAHHYYDEVEGNTVMANDTRWEFGQILPILLLAAPLSTMLGIFTSNKESSSNQISGPATFIVRRYQLSVGGSGGRSRSPGSIEMARLDAQDRPQQLNQQGAVGGDRTNPREMSTTLTNPRPTAQRNWMLPYLSSSCIVLCGHTFGLFGYATETFLRNNEIGLLGVWTPMDYLFTIKGVFCLAFLSYIFAGHAIILFGIAMDEWQGQLNSAIYWVFAVVVHTTYLLIIYLPMDWVFVKRLWMVMSVGFGLLLVFALIFILVQLSKRLLSTTSRKGNAAENGLHFS